MKRDKEFREFIKGNVYDEIIDTINKKTRGRELCKLDGLFFMTLAVCSGTCSKANYNMMMRARHMAYVSLCC